MVYDVAAVVHEDLWDNGAAALEAEMLPGPSVSHQTGMGSPSLAPSVGAHGEGTPRPHLGDVGALLPSIRHNTKHAVAPWAMECEQEQHTEERQAGPAEGVLGCVSGGQSMPRALNKHSGCGLLCTSCFAPWVSQCPRSPVQDGGLESSGDEEGVPAPAG